MAGMPELPEGPVTIMFTDIEGSTALRTSLGDAQSDILFRQHDEIIRKHVEANRGNDQGAALGDGFLAVFASTRRAVTCAIEIQRALDSFNLSRSGPPLKVRIGLNTGEVAWQEGQLSGEAVHAAARVCAVGSGGQILVSDVTRQLAGTISDVTFHDAGEFELKGFPHPWRLWDVVWVRETTARAEQVFVGRETELAQLRAKLMGALDGHGTMVLVGGEPGVGKTTLVKQLIREAEQRGALAVFGRCYESEGTVPFSPFVEMLEQALSLMPAGLVREDMGEDAAEVARLVPELRRRFPDIPEPLELPPEQQRRYFFNSIGSFITRSSARFPLLLVMDDVHWADEPTLLLMEHMAALLPELRVFAVGTYRDVELEVSRPLAAAMDRMVRARTVERIPVKRFDRAMVATMLGALARTPAPDAVVEVIFSETEGNPFFVEEVFRHLVEEGRLLKDGQFRTDIEVDELDVPESVRLVVGRRLDRLGADAQRVLAAAAVVGRAFAFSLLEAVADVDAGLLLDIVEEAEAARVIVSEERDGEVHFSFAHELIRQTLLSGLSVLRRQRLHLAVADAIERTDKRARQQRPSEIAHHLLQAGAAADSNRTLEYLELSAQRALDAAAFEEALRTIDDALSVVDPDDALRTAKLRECQGRAMRAMGDLDGCIAIFQNVVPVFAQHGLVDEAAQLCFEIGYQQVWLSRFDDAFAIYATGLAIVGEHKSASRARLLGAIGAVTGIAGLYEAAEESLREGEAMARELGDDRALGAVMWARTVSSWSNAQMEDSGAAGLVAVDCLRRANDQWVLVDALGWVSFPLLFLARHVEALEFSAEGEQLGRKLGHQAGEILSMRAGGLGRSAGGCDLEDFERAASQDLVRLDGIGSAWVSQSHVWVGVTRLLRGDTAEAVGAAERAIALEPVSAFSGVGWGLKFIATAYARDIDACRRLLDERPGSLPDDADHTAIGSLQMLMESAHGCVVAGLHDEAAALYPAVAKWCERVPMTMYGMVLSTRVAGMAAGAAHLWDDAVGHFETALGQAPELSPLDLPQVEHWYAEMLLRRGRAEDHDRARQLLTSALAAYERLGMPLHASMANELLSSR